MFQKCRSQKRVHPISMFRKICAFSDKHPMGNIWLLPPEEFTRYVSNIRFAAGLPTGLLSHPLGDNPREPNRHPTDITNSWNDEGSFPRLSHLEKHDATKTTELEAAATFVWIFLTASQRNEFAHSSCTSWICPCWGPVSRAACVWLPHKIACWHGTFGVG